MTKWSKFWTLKVFQTILNWLYHTKNPIKVTPRSDKVTPKQQEKSPQWSIRVIPSNDTLYLHNEDSGTWNNLNGKIRLFAAKIVKHSK